MLLGRSLPLNVQALICSYLPRRAQTALLRAARPSPGLFVSSTVSLSSNPPLFATPTTQRPAEQARLASVSVFEDDDPEYENVPLSRLDNPPVPRSPDESLLSLLRAGQWSEATRLLHELRDVSRQYIPPRYDFATFALAAASHDISAHSTERAWLEWWKLAPCVVTDPVHDEVVNLRGADIRMAMQAERIIKRIIEAPEHSSSSGDAASTSIDWQLLEDFAAVLSQQGHAQTVAARILPTVANYGSPEAFERIFRTALTSIAELEGRYTPEGPYLDYRPRRGTTAEKELCNMVGERLIDPQMRKEQVVKMRKWWNGRREREFKTLFFARSRAVTSCIMLGKLDMAVDLVLALPDLQHILPSTRLDITKSGYLNLLGTLAQYGRFESFEQVYQLFLDGGRKLLRVGDLNAQWPFIVRSSSFKTDQPAYSAREAFTSFRYQTAITSIEEGPATLQEQPEDISFDLPVDDADDPAGNQRSETIIRLVEENRFEESAAAVAQYVLLDSSLPSANALATWIDYARGVAAGSPEAAEVLAAVEAQASSRLLQRTFWYNAEMLSSLRAERYNEVLRLYSQAFDVNALPRAAQYAIKSRSGTRSFSRWRSRSCLVPQAYTVAILMQALVADIEGAGARPKSGATAGDASQLIGAIYNGLQDPRQNSMIAPKRSQATATSELDAPLPVVPHSAYTFVPFLLHRWRKNSSPLTVLSVLSDMRWLGIRPEAPHYSIVLNSFAKLGDSPTAEADNKTRRGSADLLYLLSVFEPATFPVEPSVVQAASPAVVSFARIIPPPAAPLPVQTYTGIIAGLRLRSERATIVQVVQRLAEARSEDVQRWAREDERFREELRSVRGIIGRAVS